MRLCLLSLPGPVPGLPASWGQIGALLFFQGVKECYPPLSSLSPHLIILQVLLRAPTEARLGEEAWSWSRVCVLALLPSSCVLYLTLCVLICTLRLILPAYQVLMKLLRIHFCFS